MDLLKGLTDPRKPRGVRRVVRSAQFCAIAEWAQGLSHETLKQLRSKHWTAPSER